MLGELMAPSSLRKAATDEALALLPALRRLPRRLDRITMSEGCHWADPGRRHVHETAAAGQEITVPRGVQKVTLHFHDA
jgi:hypothetical protein